MTMAKAIATLNSIMDNIHEKRNGRYAFICLNAYVFLPQALPPLIFIKNNCDEKEIKKKTAAAISLIEKIEKEKNMKELNSILKKAEHYIFDIVAFIEEKAQEEFRAHIDNGGKINY